MSSGSRQVTSLPGRVLRWGTLDKGSWLGTGCPCTEPDHAGCPEQLQRHLPEGHCEARCHIVLSLHQPSLWKNPTALAEAQDLSFLCSMFSAQLVPAWTHSVTLNHKDNQNYQDSRLREDFQALGLELTLASAECVSLQGSPISLGETDT